LTCRSSRHLTAAPSGTAVGTSSTSREQGGVGREAFGCLGFRMVGPVLFQKRVDSVGHMNRLSSEPGDSRGAEVLSIGGFARSGWWHQTKSKPTRASVTRLVAFRPLAHHPRRSPSLQTTDDKVEADGRKGKRQRKDPRCPSFVPTVTSRCGTAQRSTHRDDRLLRSEPRWPRGPTTAQPREVGWDQPRQSEPASTAEGSRRCRGPGWRGPAGQESALVVGDG
jgi:hypothetical protein